MTQFDIDYQNYDIVFKDSFSIFRNKVIDFLDVDIPKIDSFLDTEFAEIETNKQQLDLNFRLTDGSILHLEEEADISQEDLIRFSSYDLKLYNKYRKKIRTIILCVNGFDNRQAIINAGSFNYQAIVVDMSEKDGDAKSKQIEKKLASDEEINILDLIFLPLMNSKQGMLNRVKRAIEFEQKLDIPEEKADKVIAMTLVIADKFLTDKEISKIWGDYKMLRIFKHAEEQGEKEGIEKGRQEGRQEGMLELVEKQLLKKFKSVPQEYRERLKKQDKAKLEIIATEILEMEDIEELKDYLD